MYKYKIVIISLFVLCLYSCKTNNTDKNIESFQLDSIQEDSSKVKVATIDKDGGIPIFYNMYLSVDLSTLFKSIGAIYNPKLTNKPENIENYNTSYSKALNLGVFAVDLSYTKYFDQLEMSGKYLKIMHRLSASLGVPDDKFIMSIKRVETNMNNKDSLVRIANELYKTIQNNLKTNDREAAATLVIVGGWFEAMYIATNMYKESDKDIEFLERIEDQKNSVVSLLELIETYKDDATIKELMPYIEDVRISMSTFEVKPNNLKETLKQFVEIRKKVTAIRNKIIS